MRERIDAMFRGDKINTTEHRAVLHVALRAPRGERILVDGEDVVPDVHAVLDRMAAFAERVRNGEWTGHTGKRIRNVINIGIGGSDLGPVMAYEALRHYSRRDMTFRFVSNVDGTDFAEATRDLDPGETLFIVCSKTFTTLETLTNAHAARALVPAAGSATRRPSRSTSSRCRPTPRRSRKFGIDATNMFGFWDWVGGRYSMDSAIGLSTMIAIGAEHFPRDARRLPRDGRAFPQRAARTATCRCCMGLLAIWNNNFLGAPTVAVLPYEQYLKRFPAYLQQLTMESNGKHVTLDGDARRLRDGPDLLGRARHQRPALVLPADPPGHAARALRLHRLLPAAESRLGRPARSADGEPVRAERGAGVRQDRRRSARRRHAPKRWCRIAPSKATVRATRSWPNADAAHARRAGRAVRAQRVRAGRDLEHRLVRPVGRRARQGAGQAHRRSRSRAASEPRARARQLDQRADPALSRACASRRHLEHEHEASVRSPASRRRAALLVDVAEAGRRVLQPDARSRRCRRSASRSARRAIAARRSTAPSTSRTCSRSPRRSATTAQSQGIDGPLFIGIDTHALSVPAFESALEVLAANGVETMIAKGGEYTPTPAVSHAILVYNRGRKSGLADGIVVTPSHNPPDNGGFKYNPPNGGPADTDVTGWIEAEANALLEGKLDGVQRMPFDARAPRRHDARARLSRRLRRRSRQRRSTSMSSAARASAWASIRSAAPACTTGRGSPSATGST